MVICDTPFEVWRFASLPRLQSGAAGRHGAGLSPAISMRLDISLRETVETSACYSNKKLKFKEDGPVVKFVRLFLLGMEKPPPVDAR